MQRTMNLAEKGWLPDSFVRAGIRRLLRDRISTISSANSLTNFTDQMTKGPIALATDIANSQHYEVPSEFFQLVLGRHLKYSACYWTDGNRSLDSAEAAALEQVCERAGISDGMQVLDLGCGWGSLSLWIASRYPSCKITSVSNSAPQGALIRARAQRRGIQNIEVITADINTFEAKQKFDRIVSIEMFEHMRNYSALLRLLDSWLEPNGKLFVHIFCHRHHPYFFVDNGPNDWMARHFFTGGLMPSEHLMEEFSESLTLEERWRISGKHYEKTSLAWLANMAEHREEVLEILSTTYGEPDALRWYHRWRIFFLACAELFGYNNGNEWFVSHSLWKHRQTSTN
jgi:cyclopropane-fatty-acyl-phospholipid synthase